MLDHEEQKCVTVRKKELEQAPKPPGIIMSSISNSNHLNPGNKCGNTVAKNK